MGITLLERLSIKGRVKLIMRNVFTGKEEIDVIDNIVVSNGKEAIAARLAGDTAKANRGEITFGAVGTGSTIPIVTDTALETEFFRKILAQRSFIGNVATLRMFLNTSEGNTTLLEFGLFGEDASVTPGSGTLFNRVAINKTKTAANTLTIEVQLTVS